MATQCRLSSHVFWVWLVTSCSGAAGQAATNQQDLQSTGATQRDNNNHNLVPDGYRQEVAPWPQDGGPLLINISLKVNGIVETDARQTAVLIDSYFRIIWQDWRLNYPVEGWDEGNPRSRHGDEGQVRKMVVLPVILDKLWLPDPYILNVRSVKTVKVLKDVQGVHVYSNNTIFISTWMKIELDCSTMFSKFPFDVQECLLDILSCARYMSAPSCLHLTTAAEIVKIIKDDVSGASHSDMYEASDLQMQWLPGGLVLDPRIGRQLSNYEYEFTIDDDNASCICYNCFPPNPPCVRARLLLSRKALGHLLATFLPSGLFVAVSWASLFWPADVIPGRTVLLITALLTLVSMHTAVRQSSPDTSYVKAVDVWMIMCIVMALLALFEYLVVLIIKKRRDRAAVRDSAHVTRMVRPKNDPVKEHDRQRCSLPSEERLEQAARFFIPAVFLLFNLAYWPYFLKK